MSVTRREALSLTAASAAALALSRDAFARDPPPPKPTAVPVGGHVPIALHFEPKKLVGISEKMITSHHDKNYAGAVKNLNKVETDLANVNKDTPAYTVAGLKQAELTYTNSVILHEHYFDNLGGNGKLNGPIEKALAERFGSTARWEELFRATGASLGGGSGWVILDYSFHMHDLRTYWSSNHTQAVAFGQPLLVMDMYEHAYALDYGPGFAEYIDAFFQNINWDRVNDRFARAAKAAQALG